MTQAVADLPEPGLRVVLLSSRSVDPFYVRVLDHLFDSSRIAVVGACVDVSPVRSSVAKLRRDLRRGRGGYVAVKAIRRLLGRDRGAVVDAFSYFGDRRVPTFRTEDLYADETVRFICDCRPDCLVRAGFRIIHEPILHAAPKGVLSFHHGDIRRYRGIPFGFWELYYGEAEMGVTVQVLKEKIDAGRIVREMRVPMTRTDTWRSVRQRALAGSETLMLEACLDIADEREPEDVPDEQLGTLYSEPNLRQWLELQAKVAWRRANAALSHVPRAVVTIEDERRRYDVADHRAPRR